MKKIISCVLFLILILFSLVQLNDFLVPKPFNRYFMLEKFLEDNPEHYEHDVQVFGSCHSYTSFDSLYFEERTGKSAFVFGNPGEIIPTTYVRMVEQFKRHTPKTAFVEIWGINPYETYSTTEEILEEYLPSNVERLRPSKEKRELVDDFEELDPLEMFFPISVYKDRMTDKSLVACDFGYEFEATEEHSSPYYYEEMELRFADNGFKSYPYYSVMDYPNRQSVIEDGAVTEIEPIIVKYLLKIIALCKEKDVELIFYRAPYISTENELRKLNHLRQICEENDVLFVELEDGVNYNYYTDFNDYEHLSGIGAARMTEILSRYMADVPEHSPEHDLLYSENVQGGEPAYIAEGLTAGEWCSLYSCTAAEARKGIRVTDRLGAFEWQYYLQIEVPEDFAGKVLTAVYDISAFKGTSLHPVLSCRSADDAELSCTTSVPSKGKVLVSCKVPEGTKYVRLGFYTMEEGHEWDCVTFSGVELYDGAQSNVTFGETE